MADEEAGLPHVTPVVAIHETVRGIGNEVSIADEAIATSSYTCAAS